MKQKIHTTNYFNTFIAVADDCPAIMGEIPPLGKKAKSIARMQYEIISAYPYKFTSDDLLFNIYSERNDLTENEHKVAREKFFSKGQPCLRSSPLTKRYGWGVHHDNNGKIALSGVETNEYAAFLQKEDLPKVKGMRSKKL